MRAAALEQSKEAWLEDAVATIVGLAEKQETFTADDLRKHMAEPDDSHWPGTAFMRARNLGLIEGVDGLYVKSTTPSRNRSALKLWTKKKAVVRR
ncbi:hypothetical protein PP356_gp37 [Arthrobacter phage MargaretKali]|uniref:Helix-turn-helix DNA-binding domain protein n=1 Tax=Arthrobacter phage MargaretKali TaxID=2250414 RepID=A0A345KN15_9CAUD|nr:hypothetical protein PP356_gp37 [Arthrobacter phage MargaretKali]AXH44417.1 hypothetical protein SEA_MARGARETKALI_37 [Arthrobacter phage MargaretKali]